MRLPPLRALDDFVLGSARLVAPDPCDPQRWCHRVINNLLYYQTNYLICFGLSLALAGCGREGGAGWPGMPTGMEGGPAGFLEG